MDGVKRYVANLYHGDELMFFGADVVLASAHTVALDAAQSELAALREELAAAKRNEHNSEVAYKAAIEKQEELREEVAMLRDTYEAPFKPGGTTLQQRLTAAEQRNANVYLQLGDLLTDLQGQYPSARIEEIQSLLTKPTESGASE